jgi:hypothetical protein
MGSSVTRPIRMGAGVRVVDILISVWAVNLLPGGRGDRQLSPRFAADIDANGRNGPVLWPRSVSPARHVLLAELLAKQRRAGIDAFRLQILLNPR